jgi:hypothetical protein
VDDDAGRKPILGRYVRAYASTLIRREHDWLILHMMSTPGNAGGTWGLFCMTAPNAGGPCSEPTPLVLPQSDVFHPPLAEFFPAYVVGDRVYAPATSVAANRSYQSLFSAPLEQAHRAEAWRIERLGSLWHGEPVPWEARGIWGQTFAAALAPGNLLRAMFPCKTAEDVGTISIARRPLRKALKDGFVLAGPNGQSHAVLRHAYGAFTLDADLVARGPWHLAFGCRDALGSNHPYADSRPHALMGSGRTVFRFSPEGWKLSRSQDGTRAVVASGPVGEGIKEGKRVSLRVQCGDGHVAVRLAGQPLFDAALLTHGGRIELVAEEGGHLTVERFAVSGSSEGYWEDWLATEALAGAACAPDEWKPVRSPEYLYGEGFVSARPGARAKFNFEGISCELHGPLGQHYGTASIIIDGKRAGIADFNAPAEKPSDRVFVANLRPGRHALVLSAGEAMVPLDCLRVLR